MRYLGEYILSAVLLCVGIVCIGFALQGIGWLFDQAGTWEDENPGFFYGLVMILGIMWIIGIFRREVVKPILDELRAKRGKWK